VSLKKTSYITRPQNPPPPNLRIFNLLSLLELSLKWGDAKGFKQLTVNIKDTAMKTRILGFVVLMACVVGCVPSLHELYTKDTLVYDPALVATWQENDSTWTFKGDPNNKSYELLIVEQDKERGRLENKMEARLVELSGKRYLDLFPQKEVKLNVGNWFNTGLLRAHIFIKAEIKDAKLLLAIMKPDVVERMVEKDPTVIKHEKTEDRIVLTASPKELQEFIKKNVGTKDFFGEPEELTRKEAKPAAK
jgi:hypothetical protein